MRKEEYFRKSNINPESRIKQENQESIKSRKISEKKESQKKEEKEGKTKQSKARKVCPPMGDLFSHIKTTKQLSQHVNINSIKEVFQLPFTYFSIFFVVYVELCLCEHCF